jgi:ATP-dependent helicase YprA (DUF1998 family)/very-short-patch-repair endonuclease
MNVFELRERLVSEYESFVRSFVRIRDPRIHQVVATAMAQGELWPDPLLQLNPHFEPGESLQELVQIGELHPTCREIFRKREGEPPAEAELRLHRHQVDGIRAARTGANYVLTTGTGSGKSLAYLVPIIDEVLRTGSGKGIRAIIVYPMNALANSQCEALKGFLDHPRFGGKRPVTFERYTGEVDDDARDRIAANPPDILLTNFVMLDLMLTRGKRDKQLVHGARDLRFLVLDELHTYRGRQGADVAMLVRRVREAVGSKRLQCVGTSATIASRGTPSEQRQRVAEVATRLFGDRVEPQHVIGETLRSVTARPEPDDAEFRARLAKRIAGTAKHPKTWDEFRADPLTAWIEWTLGLARQPATGELVRARPRGLKGEDGLGRVLSADTGESIEHSTERLKQALLNGFTLIKNPESNAPAFAFRLHQFVSRGDTVYATIESPSVRYATIHAQLTAPEDSTKTLLPLVFCRECGQDYYCVWRQVDDRKSTTYFKREISDRHDDDDSRAGYLYVSDDLPWTGGPEHNRERIPDDWFEQVAGKERIRSDRKNRLPQPVCVVPDGQEGGDGIDAAFIPAPFLFCVRCGVSYDTTQKADFGKLARLSSEGRSTAVTILTLATLRGLAELEGIHPEARKLLSFTDNRQDASLQAGHFNDFVQIAVLRSALWRAVHEAGSAGIPHDLLPLRVFAALGLPLDAYAVNPNVRFHQREETDRALRDFIAYRVYVDLRRGWRLTAPNLEQCGLLSIRYTSLDELCAAQDIWANAHPALRDASPQVRRVVAHALLDHLRRELAIHVDFLDATFQESMRQRVSQSLIEPWRFDERESDHLEKSTTAFPGTPPTRDRRAKVMGISPRSAVGRFLSRPQTFAHLGRTIDVAERRQVIDDVMAALLEAQLVQIVEPADGKDSSPGYRIPARAMTWVVGDGTQAYHDPIRVPNRGKDGGIPNEFFVAFYRQLAATLVGLEAREHTAQVPHELREQREERFREGDLEALFCSPTMELGIDIATLNAVSMRNVPPTPANYAQRSGRAGRSGQPALVFTYCSSGSAHDQYFFRRPELMVRGSVEPPALELANEDLVRSHVHAILLATSGLEFATSLTGVLDVGGERPTLSLQPQVRDALCETSTIAKAQARAERVLASIEDELSKADWYSSGWLARTLQGALTSLDDACARWRELYRSAMDQTDRQNKVLLDSSRTADERERAKRLHSEAYSQLNLLRQETGATSDFYSYRYLASEGFLPGYSFPRLPLSAYLPSRSTRKQQDDFLSRPRFLAIHEFGPRSLIYHEGARYQVQRVILPPSAEGVTRAASICEACGYLHPRTDEVSPDMCENCGVPLSCGYTNLLRLTNVSTRRKDRISSDEEERLKLGYDMRTVLRFAEREGRPTFTSAEVECEGGAGWTLRYGPAATLWRINQGWRKRKNKSELGFRLDVERGIWERESNDDDEADDDRMVGRVLTVIPYVEDRRNSLVLEPKGMIDDPRMASLQAALKRAIQARYQLEDSEVAAEPLPGEGAPRTRILFYEAAEGGAGALRQLVQDKDALAALARQAMEICHFDPETGEDRGKAEHASEPCAQACYDCLMSYTNQRDHELLDRHIVVRDLMALRDGRCTPSPSPMGAAEHFDVLLRACQSELEKRFLRFLKARGLRLPSHAQRRVEKCGTRPDFFYDHVNAAIYVDGPHHDYPERQRRDERQQSCLDDLGVLVLRFRHEDDWKSIVEQHRSVFGEEVRPEPEHHRGFDPDLFPGPWRTILETLATHHHVEVEPGDDLVVDGRVIAQSVATLRFQARQIRVIDADRCDAQTVDDAQRLGGPPLVRVAPLASDALERLRSQLEIAPA